MWSAGRTFRALDPQASADGKRLIAVQGYTRKIGIYIGNLAVWRQSVYSAPFHGRRLVQQVDAWTKDSKAILFSSKRNGSNWAIFKQDIDAKTPETLIAGSEHYWAAQT